MYAVWVITCSFKTASPCFISLLENICCLISGHENSVFALIAQNSSESSDESVHPHSLARALSARTRKT